MIVKDGRAPNPQPFNEELFPNPRMPITHSSLRITDPRGGITNESMRGGSTIHAIRQCGTPPPA
jgi:hypothetical protein